MQQPMRAVPSLRRAARGRLALALAALSLVGVGAGCASLADFRKLEYEVNKLKTQGGARGGAPGSRAEVADLAAEVEALRGELAALRGRVEVAEHRVDEALGEARSARQEAAGGPAPDALEGTAEPGELAPGSATPAEVEAYRQARAAWRAGDLDACITGFRDFLRSYPASEHADDAAYWMADCHLRQGDLEMAILRFDDVVRRYPTGDKAPEALYRQGEALLRLGPSHGQAAQQAFQRLINEYPESARVAEARRQLDLLGAESG